MDLFDGSKANYGARKSKNVSFAGNHMSYLTSPTAQARHHWAKLVRPLWPICGSVPKDSQRRSWQERKELPAQRRQSWQVSWI